MPVDVTNPTGLFDRELRWTGGEEDDTGDDMLYAVQDGVMLQTFVLDHVERHDDDFNVKWNSDALTFSFPDGPGPENRYRIEPDGTIRSGYCLETADQNGLERHRTITESRLNALIGRANKTQELVDYVQEFKRFGVEETVFSRYCKEPVLAPTDLEKTIMKKHGGKKLDSIKRQEPYLLNRAGAADVSDSDYETLLDAVVHGEPYSGELPGATKLDFEICTKGRDMTDWYDIEDRDARKTARSTYRTAMQAASRELGMDDIFQEVTYQNRLVYGDWGNSTI